MTKKTAQDSATNQNILIVAAANPSDTEAIDIRREMKQIQEALSLSTSGSKLFRVHPSTAATFNDLRRDISREQPNIVQFSGHGDSTGLYFEDADGHSQRIPNAAISRLFQEFSEEILCVVLVASCYTAQLARSISKHIPFVIGIPGKLPDKAALAFSEGFYEALAVGRSIDSAYRFGRNAASLETTQTRSLPQLLTSGKQFVPVDPERRQQHGQEQAERLLDFAQKHSSENWAGFNRMAAQTDNLIMSFYFFFDEERWKEVIDFRRPLTDFLHSYGRHNDAIEIGEHCFKAADSTNNDLEKAWTSIYPLAREYFHLRDLSQATEWAQRGQLLFKKEDCRDGEAAALRYSGRILEAQDRHQDAKLAYCEALSVLQSGRWERNDPGIRILRGHLQAATGGIELQIGNLTAAKKGFKHALRNYSRADHSVGVAWMHSQLAQVERAAGNVPGALSLMERAEREIVEAKAPLKEAEITVMFATLTEEAGDSHKSRILATRAREMCQYTDNAAGVREAEALLGLLAKSVEADEER